ncbi:MAG: polymer-forming cytoskeletal protein [Phycisphaerales bacterium JB063]
MAEASETTVVGADSYFKGELMFESTAKIVGKFDGTITGKGELQVSKNAKCNADVKAGSVAVDGRVEGNVTVSDTVKLNGSGVVKGDITAAKMVVVEGASFMGMCAVGPEAQKQAGAASASSPKSDSGSGGSGGGGQSGKK